MTKSILCINPNSSSSVTESIGRSCDRGIKEGVQVSLFQAPSNAPPSIDDFTTSVLSAAACYPLLLSELSKHDAFLVACYSDHPLTRMLRNVVNKPVMSILEAGVKVALRDGGTFGVVTTGEGWIQPLTRANLDCLDESDKSTFMGVAATGLGVLEFHPNEDNMEGGQEARERVHHRIASTSKRLAESNQVDTIILGCAGMEGMEKAILEGVTNVGYEIRVVDAVCAGTELLCAELLK